jgi:hypothetical protein
MRGQISCTDARLADAIARLWKEEQTRMPNQQDNRGGKPQGGQNTGRQGGNRPGMDDQDDRRPQSNTPGQGKKQQPGTDTRRGDVDNE